LITKSFVPVLKYYQDFKRHQFWIFQKCQSHEKIGDVLIVNSKLFDMIFLKTRVQGTKTSFLLARMEKNCCKEKMTQDGKEY
jgi:hypothetical protein